MLFVNNNNTEHDKYVRHSITMMEQAVGIYLREGNTESCNLSYH